MLRTKRTTRHRLSFYSLHDSMSKDLFSHCSGCLAALGASSALIAFARFKRPECWAFAGQLAASVRPGGSVLVFGALGGITLDGIGLRDILFRGVIVTGFWLSRYLPSLGDERRRQVLGEVMQLLEDGVIKPKGGEGASVGKCPCTMTCATK